jgi:methylated-DNA-[protein]-cysteine S-methyltransferase
MTNRHCFIDSAIGPLTLVADGDTLTGLYFPRHWHLPAESSFGARVELTEDPVFAEVERQLTQYFDGDRTDFDLPIELHGDPLQLRVWELLTRIPYGQTVTYGELANALADGTNPWQVGQAVGRNPVSIIVPCHRVVGKGGALTGYAGGLARKRFLLEREEAADASLARLF